MSESRHGGIIRGPIAIEHSGERVMPLVRRNETLELIEEFAEVSRAVWIAIDLLNDVVSERIVLQLGHA